MFSHFAPCLSLILYKFVITDVLLWSVGLLLSADIEMSSGLYSRGPRLKSWP